MDIFSAVILGVVQGLTEFLPVSSTGHLILAREILGLQVAYGLSVDAALHLATALAVLMYFLRDLLRLTFVTWRWLKELPHKLFQYTGIVREEGIGEREQKDRTLVVALILGTIPAVVIGLLLENIAGTAFRNPLIVALALVAGSILFLIAEHVAKRKQEYNTAPTAGGGFVIGLFQALALIPGMSRSGMTIAGGLILGLTREEAARFGFLLSIPIILGAGGKSAYELGLTGVIADIGMALVISAIAAFLTAIVVIHYLLKYLRTHTLMIFVVYRIALAILVLAFIF